MSKVEKLKAVWSDIDPIFSQLHQKNKTYRLHYYQAQKTDTELVKLIESMIGSVQSSVNETRAIYEKFQQQPFNKDGFINLSGKMLGAYRIKKNVAESQYSTVYFAEREGEFAQSVAVKVIHPKFCHSQNIQFFSQERDILAALNHPNIAQIYDTGLTENGYPYIIMEWVDGTNILDYVNSEALSVEQIILLMQQIGSALQYAHDKCIIHSDIKPYNILVTKQGFPKLVDFGIAQVSRAQNAANPLARGFTPGYAAPEQISSDSISAATDVFALGIVFYQLLTKRMPDSTESNTESSERNDHLLERIPAEVAAIINKATQADTMHRYPSIHAFLADLKRYQMHYPITAYSSNWLYRVGKALRRNPVPSSLISLSFVFLAMLSLSLQWQVERVTQAQKNAELQADRAEKTVDLIKTIFSAAKPIVRHHPDMPAVELIEKGLSLVEDKQYPSVSMKEELQLIIVDIFEQLGRFDRSQALLKGIIDDRKLANHDQDMSFALLSLRYGESLATSISFRKSNDFEVAKTTLYDGLTLLDEFNVFNDSYVNAIRSLLFLKRKTQNIKEIDSMIKNTVEKLKQPHSVGYEHAIQFLLRYASSCGRLGNIKEAWSVYKMIERLIVDNSQKATKNLYNYVFIPGYAIIGAKMGFAKDSLTVLNDYYYFSKQHPELSTLASMSIHESEALIFSLQGEHDKAYKAIKKSQQTIRNMLGSDHVKFHLSNLSLGEIAFNNRDFSLASEVIANSKSYFLKTEGQNGIHVFMSDFLEGKILFAHGEFNLAELKFNQLLDSIQENHYQQTGLAGEIYDYKRQLASIEEAWSNEKKYAERSFEASKKALGESHAKTLARGQVLLSLLEREHLMVEAETLALELARWSTNKASHDRQIISAIFPN